MIVLTDSEHDVLTRTSRRGTSRGADAVWTAVEQRLTQVAEAPSPWTREQRGPNRRSPRRRVAIAIAGAATLAIFTSVVVHTQEAPSEQQVTSSSGSEQRYAILDPAARGWSLVGVSALPEPSAGPVLADLTVLRSFAGRQHIAASITGGLLGSTVLDGLAESDSPDRPDGSPAARISSRSESVHGVSLYVEPLSDGRTLRIASRDMTEADFAAAAEALASRAKSSENLELAGFDTAFEGPDATGLAWPPGGRATLTYESDSGIAVTISTAAVPFDPNAMRWLLIDPVEMSATGMPFLVGTGLDEVLAVGGDASVTYLISSSGAHAEQVLEILQYLDFDTADGWPDGPLDQTGVTTTSEP